MNKAVVVFSGGQDSTTCLGWALNRFDLVECITFNYGQKHSVELTQAAAICDELKVNQVVVDISFLDKLVDSALTSNGNVNEVHPRLKHLPASFVPNRNALFLTLAHAYAQKIGADHIVTGVCETDFSGYSDCRDVFIKSLNDTLNLGTFGYLIGVDWLTGFIEGEGWFSRQSYKLKSGEKKYYPTFAICQAERNIIQQIHDFFGCGSIRKETYKGKGFNGLSKKEIWTFKLSGKDCSLVYNLLKDRVKTTNKSFQFKEWVNAHEKYLCNDGIFSKNSKYNEMPKIETPLMFKNKADIFRMAKEEDVFDIVIKMSHTCYNGVREMHEWGAGCGECPACKLRQKGYQDYLETL